MTRDHASSLRELQALEFTAIELNLYLDTHPEDERALADYNRIVQELAIAKREYEQIHGPLIHYGWSQSRYPWQWATEPWPWEA